MPQSTLPHVAGAPRRVLHIVHGWPPFAMGGTEQYAAWLVHQQRHWRQVRVHARMADPKLAQGEAREVDDRGVPVRLVNNLLQQRNPLVRNSVLDRRMLHDVDAELSRFQPDLVHVHHLLGHGFALNSLLRRRGMLVVQQVQDWWALCAHANYTHRSGKRCDGPALDRCHDCAVLTRLRPEALSNRLMHVIRRQAARRALACADAYIMGSDAVRQDYVNAGLFAPRAPVHVLPYGVDVPETRTPRPPASLPLRFGFVGSPTPHKGLQVARAAFAEIDPALATLQVWGYAGTRFAEAEKASVYAAMDVLLFPSIGLESFGLAAYEAMAHGVPVIATDDGALRDVPGARHFPSGDSATLRALILELAQNPVALDTWRRGLPHVRSAAEHALAVEAVYTDLLAQTSHRAR